MPRPNIPPKTHQLRAVGDPFWLTTADITPSTLVPQLTLKTDAKKGRRNRRAPAPNSPPITDKRTRTADRRVRPIDRLPQLNLGIGRGTATPWGTTRSHTAGRP